LEILLIIDVSPVSVPPGLPMRIPPRPVEDRQEGYMESFDSDTLFYDIFADNLGRVILSGPPMFNLR
jgi:hypothetical protein